MVMAGCPWCGCMSAHQQRCYSFRLGRGKNVVFSFGTMQKVEVRHLVIKSAGNVSNKIHAK